MFFDKIGKVALGSRLRHLSDRVTEDAVKLYDLYNVELKPKWFPVFYVLSEAKQGKAITAIAGEIGQSHPAVIKTVKEMVRAGLVLEKKDKADGRKNNILLTEKGWDVADKIKDQYADVNAALEHTLSQTSHNIWAAIEELEFLLNEKSLFNRVLKEKKLREAENVKIVPYQPKYREVFKNLNKEWITTYFKMEEADLRALNHPEEYIINQGGEIWIALYNNIPAGVCALIKMEQEGVYELAKMAVSSKAQGKGIGWLLGNAMVQRVKTLGASKLYLESNTVLEPAIKLYQKLGFTKVSGNPTPYERSNIQMELKII